MKDRQLLQKQRPALPWPAVLSCAGRPSSTADWSLVGRFPAADLDLDLDLEMEAARQQQGKLC